MEKLCPACKQIKPFDSFPKKHGKPGSYCKPCQAAYVKAHYLRNKERYKTRTKVWREDNRERYLNYNRQHYIENREQILEQCKEYATRTKDEQNARKARWRKLNPDKTLAAEAAYRARNRDACNARIKAWKADHKYLLAFYTQTRAARLQDATPQWANEMAIKEIYKRAKEMRDAGEQIHVDHIVPLNGKIVCGLHWEANLQILPEKENLRKNCHRWPDMP